METTRELAHVLVALPVGSRMLRPHLLGLLVIRIWALHSHEPLLATQVKHANINVLICRIRRSLLLCLLLHFVFGLTLTRVRILHPGQFPGRLERRRRLLLARLRLAWR